MKRIEKVRKAKSELVSKSRSLIELMQRVFKKASGQLETMLRNYEELLIRNKFCDSELKKIQEIESLDIIPQTFEINAIASVVQNTYSKDLSNYEKFDNNGIDQFLIQHSGGFLVEC